MWVACVGSESLEAWLHSLVLPRIERRSDVVTLGLAPPGHLSSLHAQQLSVSVTGVLPVDVGASLLPVHDRSPNAPWPTLPLCQSLVAAPVLLVMATQTALHMGASQLVFFVGSVYKPIAPRADIYTSPSAHCWALPQHILQCMVEPLSHAIGLRRRGIVCICFIPCLSNCSRIAPAVNSKPLSITTSIGKPNHVKITKSASHTVIALLSRRGSASA